MYSIVCLDNLISLEKLTSTNYIDGNGIREFYFYSKNFDKIISVIPMDIGSIASEYVCLSDTTIISGANLTGTNNYVTSHSVIVVYLN